VENVRHDPYRTCEQACNHDLARAVTIEELFGEDGPFPPSPMIVTLASSRAVLFDDDELPLEQPAARVV